MNNGKAKYDWVMLKQEFFDSEILEINTFIQHKYGKETAKSGQVLKMTTGWTNAKREWKKNKNAEVQRQIRKDLIEKLKVPLEESLGIRSMLSQSDAHILSIFLRIMDKENPPTEKEMEFFRAFPDKFADVWKRVQIELGLPTNVGELRGVEDLPISFKNLIINAESINRKKKEEKEKKEKEKKERKEKEDVE